MNSSIKEFLYGSTKTYRVSGVQEAVELAQRLQQTGEFDWFRGQVHSWPPYASLIRLQMANDEDRFKDHQFRLMLFMRWLQETPELAYLLEAQHTDDFFAILQHYGRATDLIDFTTDPTIAAFFACDVSTPAPGNESCIYCLNTERLKETASYVRRLEERKSAILDAITIDVRNLWRLQAQRGVFVRANYNWDVDYPLDRIVFPRSALPSYPTRDHVYPINKSALELALDRYFSLEGATYAAIESRKIIADAQARGQHASMAHWEHWSTGYYDKAFVAEPTVLPSWENSLLSGWHADPVETFHDTIGPTIKIPLEATESPPAVGKRVKYAIQQILRNKTDLREKTVEWTFPEAPNDANATRLQEAFRAAWNGMRLLPYSDDEIANALGTISALVSAGLERMSSNERAGKIIEAAFGPAMLVEFAHRDGSGSRGWTAVKRLNDALRPDMASFIVPEHASRVDDPRELFKIIYNPARMFDFDRLRSAFADEIIPTQAVLERSPILFNPAQLLTFGLP